MDDMFTAQEMQKKLSVTRATVYKWTREGRIPYVKICRKVRYPAAAIEAWLSRKLQVENDNV